MLWPDSRPIPLRPRRRILPPTRSPLRNSRPRKGVTPHRVIHQPPLHLLPQHLELIVGQLQYIVPARSSQCELERVDGPAERLSIVRIAIIADEADPGDSELDKQTIELLQRAPVHVFLHM